MTVMRTLFTVLLIALFPVCVLAEQEDSVFPITEQSVLDAEGNLESDFLRYGAAAIFAGPCGKTPTPDVKYPELKSAAPLYGQVSFRTALDSPADAREYCFVLDATGSDASKYDALYFDVNRDRDLTNDPKSGLPEKPPGGLSLLGMAGGASSIFDFLELSDYQPGAPPAKFLPWLSVQNREQAYLIVMSTVVRKGKIQIGQQSYQVVLGRQFQGQRGAVLIKPEAADGPPLWQSVPLGSLQQLSGDFFTLSVDAKVEQLTVSPYRGEYGEIGIQPGDDAPPKVGLAVNLYKQDRSRITMGDLYAADLPRQYRVPAGDYLANLYVDYGDVRAVLSSQGYDLQIRDGKPLALRFSEKPTVMFTTPAAGKVFRPGDKVDLKAMLREPTYGMLLRGVYDTTKTTQQRTIRNSDGTSRDIPVYETLEPSVSIADSSGKQMAEGKMPFG